MIKWRNTLYVVAIILLLLWLTSISGFRPLWLKDYREKLAKHPTRVYSRRLLSQIKRIVIHHSGTPVDYTVEQIANYHVEPGNHICAEGCPEIAYHFVLDYKGTGYQVNDLEEISYHAGDYNSDSVAICLIGDYNVLTPKAIHYRRIRQLIRYVEAQVGHKLEIDGHGDLRDTTCPGHNMDLAKLMV
jgi:hypothetical protein